jgi:two-component system OmpR family sensor kinase
VTTIRGYAELYRLGGLGTDAELSEAMRRTEQEAVRMARLVDDMLALAKLGAGRPLERRELDVAQLVRDAASDARAVAPERAISVEVPDRVVVEGDEDRLRQVIANVVGNALTHTPTDTPIELRVVGHTDRAEIEVTDHGPGMTAEVAQKVTERFYRADPARARDRGGSGLGMAIVDATVSAHGGSVDVVSQPGRGTTVRVTLPTRRTLPSPASPASVPAPPSTPPAASPLPPPVPAG